MLFAAVASALLVVLAGRAEGETTLASWYGPGFEGNPTASGETFDPYGYTAAHKTLPFGTQLTVSYKGSSVGVTVNDRGPFVGGRGLDLSQGAAEAIGLSRVGVDYVEYGHSGASYDQYAAEQQYADEAAAYDAQYAEATTDQYASDSRAAVQFDDEFAGSETSDYTPRRAVRAEVQQPLQSNLSGELYVVRPGDTLSEISARFGVSVETLAATNGVGDPDFILAGQILYY